MGLVRVLHVEAQEARGRRPAGRGVEQHDHGVADAHFGVLDAAAVAGDAAEFDGAERVDRVADEPGRVPGNEPGRDRGVAVWDGHGGPPLPFPLEARGAWRPVSGRHVRHPEVMSDTPGRLLSLLSLLQMPRTWPGDELARRLGVSRRTVRRDVERLRELGYPVRTAMGADGGYRLVAGTAMPPLLLDDEEAVAIAAGLRTAAASAIEGMEDASVRALAKLEQVRGICSSDSRLSSRPGSCCLGGNLVRRMAG
jgi:biotin operon repressor